MIVNLVRNTNPASTPIYIVDGVTQSHWLAENSVLSGSTVDSVTDVSALENLVKYSAGPTYEATGWGGDSGPSILFSGTSSVKLRANGWATRVAGIRKPFTITAKIQIVTNGDYATPWGFNVGNAIHLAPRRLNATNFEIYRSTNYTYKTGTPAMNTNRHNWYVEYTGEHHRFWVDGTEASYASSTGSTTNVSADYTTFSIGGWQDTRDLCNFRLAEMHIYSGVFLEAQRNILLTDLQNRRGT